MHLEMQLFFFSVGWVWFLKTVPKLKKGGLKIKKNSTKTGMAQVLIELKQKSFRQQLSLN